MKKRTFLPGVIFLLLILAGCEKDQMTTTPLDDQGIEWRSDDCFNFKSDFAGCLGVFTLEVGGLSYTGFGALESPGWVGPYEGSFASVILETTPEDETNGAVHYKLIHKFVDKDGDYFYTDDRAVCAPARGQGIVCMINDQMTIAGGTGKYARATGKIKTHGPIRYDNPDCPFGFLTLTLNGHVCLK